MWSGSLNLAGLFLALTATTAAKQECSPGKIPYPEYFGTKVVRVEANEVKGYDTWTFIDHQNTPFDRSKAIDFCNVSITYTHPGLGDTVNVYVWLPLEGWNGNFWGQGGTGWLSGHDGSLAPAVALGYAAANTDGGHDMQGDLVALATSSESWSLASQGNVDWTRLQDFASIALDDMTHLAKAVVESYYGQKQKYSYWNGCSTGGRQGLMLAQRYPKNFDGILAFAPAINWATFLVAEQWGQVVMSREKYFPPTCEFEAIRMAAIEACDDLDGVKDGMISAPGLCHFDAQSVVGQKYSCDGDERKISKSVAKIVNEIWEGPHLNGKRMWHGLPHETPLSGQGMLGGLAQTMCDEKNENCKGAPFPISKDWIEHFIAKDSLFDVTTMTEDDFFRFLHQSQQQYESIMSANDPDLSAFRQAGGKMITWHGLADELIYVNGTSDYYERVLALDPKARDFYRYFEAPGIGHCAGGIGAYPGDAINSLVNWVEKGKAPEHLDAATLPADKDEVVKNRLLCPYPQVAAYKGGDANAASSFECADGFGQKKAKVEHAEL